MLRNQNTKQGVPGTFHELLEIDRTLRPIGRRRLPSQFLSGATDGTSLWLLLDGQLVEVHDKTNFRAIATRAEWELQVLAGGAICRSAQVLKTGIPGDPQPCARCRLPGVWTFEGQLQRFAPVRCGKWLVEPIEIFPFTALASALRVRSFAKGEEVSRRAGSAGQMICLPDDRVLDIESQSVFSLPGLHRTGRARCGGKGVSSVALKPHGNGSPVCLDQKGGVGALVLLP